MNEPLVRLHGDPRWSREDVQRVLFHVVKSYDQANMTECIHDGKLRRAPKRFVFFGPRLPMLGGDSELLRDAIRIARETLKDNNWWPRNPDEPQPTQPAWRRSQRRSSE